MSLERAVRAKVRKLIQIQNRLKNRVKLKCKNFILQLKSDIMIFIKLI